MSRLSFTLLATVSAAAAAGTAYSIAGINKDHVPTRVAVASPVPAEPAVSGLGAVGVIEPNGSFIQIGSPVSGLVSKVHVTPGATVSKGDPLFAIDSRAARAKLQTCEAELRVDRARLDEMQARRPVLHAAASKAMASVDMATAALADAEDLLRRSRTAGSGVSKRQMVERRLHVRTRQAELRSAEAQLSEAQSQLDNHGNSLGVLAAEVDKAKASVAGARTDLEMSIIRAPIAGTVLKINIHPGEYAKAGAQNRPPMIIGDTSLLTVRVDVNEADIQRFDSNTPAVARLRTSIATELPLSMVRVEPLLVPKRNLTGAIGEKVDTRVMQVIYAIDRSPPGLMPGQLVDVVISAN